MCVQVSWDVILKMKTATEIKKNTVLYVKSFGDQRSQHTVIYKDPFNPKQSIQSLCWLIVSFNSYLISKDDSPEQTYCS